ncbi:acyl-CoA synthetase [Sphingopyxis flava]|uniref:Acyl-CoA synthetase (AMP-forming)/AMP-acid ligase II n=1 Tax=Sphingopyxis flava TaxID=1507287 RepID=A0A1T5ANC6_9SPHN|nr:acyl-CoA synthetase [Sphingopyxis flava]SKB36466.1 Acyl-CoA synthetase (AMP-forming)/AMP-acid ligase II [Sphingopyxis flava]
MHPSVHVRTNPQKPAVIVAETGEAISYAELDAASNRAAQMFRAHGLEHEDVIAFMLDNTPHYYGLTWGAQRAGLRYVCISSRLTQDETDYILENSGAKMLVVAASLAPAALQLRTKIERFSMGGDIAGWPRIENELARMPAEPIADERAGVDMLYSSGTTGRPKGVRVPLPEEPAIDAPNSLVMLASMAFGINSESIYLSPAPLYHAAPLRWSMTIHRLGGTVVLMKKFDPEGALAAIQHYRCNAAQFVPTHFVRMLKLPEAVRAQYDVSTMKSAIHAAAPCPIPVKLAMIDWWGPVLLEYYAGSEGNGMTFATSQDWLAHKGTVGRAINGVVHIVGEDNETEVPVGEEGTVFFESESVFEYHDDPEKTAASRNSKGWSTLGDVGRLDEDGFLYLTDRKSFMIISGGVNIYPQEIENHLVTHPKVADVAVVGGPHEEMGEEVIAVVQPADMVDATDAFRDELIAYAREKLSGVKIPRRIDFLDALPRHDTGKLYKRLLRDRYWEQAKEGA